VYAPLVEVAGEAAPGLAYVAKDADGTVRRFFTEAPSDGKPIPTLVGQLCRSLALDCKPGLIDYSRGEPFKYVPLNRVLAAATTRDPALTRELAGKIVFIGTVLPFLDRARQSVPLAGWEDGSRDAPAVLAQAQALRSALKGTTISPLAFWGVLLLVLAAASVWYVPSWQAGLAVAIAAFAVLWIASAALLRAGLWIPVTAGGITLAFAWSARAAREAWAGWRERERLRAMFAGYVSPNVLAGLLEGRIGAGSRAERRTLAFLFADLRGFTALSEQAEPEAVLALLNRHFAVVIEAIHRHDGTLDNFRGDGVMAIFGAPKPLDNPVASAWAAIADLRAGLAALNAELTREGRPPLVMGVGLSFGEAVVGHLGSSTRYDFTAIGDAVNVAARLQEFTKTTGCGVVVSDAAREKLGDGTGLVDLGELVLAGHSPVRAWGLRES
jgi:class 3 adenylate cyclase